MSLMMMLASGSQRMVTQTFTADATWTPGPTVTRIDKLVGKGSDGTTTSSTSETWHTVTIVTTYSLRSGGFTRVTTNGGDQPGPAPANYCDDYVYTPDDPTYDFHRTCYQFTQYTEVIPATQSPGIAAQGFGKSFPGGPGGLPATPLTYTNLPVTPGQPYPMTIVSNGYITISYLE